METTHMMPASLLLSLFFTVLLSQNPIVQGQFSPWNGSPNTSPWTTGIQRQQFPMSGFSSTFDTQPGGMMNGWQSNLINQFNGQNFQNPSTQQDNTGRIQNPNFDNPFDSGLQQQFMSSNGIGDPNSPQSTQNGGFGQFQDPSMLGGDLSAFNFARPNNAGMFANSNFQASIPNNFQAGGNIDLPMNLRNGPGGMNMWNANQLGTDVPVAAPTQTSVPQWLANIPQGMPMSNPSDSLSNTPNEFTNSGNNSALNMLEATFARFSQGQQGNAISPFLQGQQDNTVSPFLQGQDNTVSPTLPGQQDNTISSFEQGQQDNAISTIPQGQLDNPLSTFQQTQQDNTISPFSQGQQDNTASQISQSQPDNTRSLFPPGPQDNTRSLFPPGQQDNTLSPFMQGQQDNTLSPFMQGQQANTLSPFMQGQQANTRFPFMNRFNENRQTQQMGDPQQWQPNFFGPSNWGMNEVRNPGPFDNFSPFDNSRFFAR